MREDRRERRIEMTNNTGSSLGDRDPAAFERKCIRDMALLATNTEKLLQHVEGRRTAAVLQRDRDILILPATEQREARARLNVIILENERLQSLIRAGLPFPYGIESEEDRNDD